jgi:hypothetical protein
MADEPIIDGAEWAAIAAMCPIPTSALPRDASIEEQIAFLKAYRAQLAARGEGGYECYECIERILVPFEAAEDSPFMDV